jgi:glutamate 5-kinase
VIREDIATARRIVVKVGSSSLTTPDGAIDEDRIGGLVAAIATRHPATQVVLVSSGAIAAGLAPLKLKRRPKDLAMQQAAASVGQGLLVARYTASFSNYGVGTGQVLLSADDLMRRAHYRNAQRALDRLLDLGIVPVVNENDTVATDEIRFGDNDRLAALVAHVTRADALILLSDVDGLYDGDPRRGDAIRIETVLGAADLAGVSIGRSGSGVGTGGMATKVESAQIATAAGIPTVVASAGQAGAALAGEPVGTYFAVTGKRPAARLLWLAHAAVARGALRLDNGAVEAVVVRRKSLLPAGIIGVDGVFDAGDPVNLADASGTVVARGLVSYDASEIPGLMGRSTRWLASRLGPEYEREVVHRDDLVILLGRCPQAGPRARRVVVGGQPAHRLDVTGPGLYRSARLAGEPAVGVRPDHLEHRRADDAVAHVVEREQRGLPPAHVDAAQLERPRADVVDDFARCGHPPVGHLLAEHAEDVTGQISRNPEDREVRPPVRDPHSDRVRPWGSDFLAVHRDGRPPRRIDLGGDRCHPLVDLVAARLLDLGGVPSPLLVEQRKSHT